MQTDRGEVTEHHAGELAYRDTLQTHGRPRQIWTYYGVNVHPQTGVNSSGIPLVEARGLTSHAG